jgi:catechol 2,3-dioxygenase-like lactoylglutathione lyase family enzyme
MPTSLSKPVIFVKDVSVSKRFYQDLFSLEVEHDFGEYIDFHQFGLWQKKKAEEIIFGSESNEDGLKDLELYFESDEIELIRKRIDDKSIIHDIREEPWGQKTLRFFDPDGFIIEVAESLDSTIKRLSRHMSPEEVSKKTQMPLDHVKKHFPSDKASIRP